MTDQQQQLQQVQCMIDLESDFRLVCLVPTDDEAIETLGFFEAIEHERAQAEMARMLAKKKIYPIAPDGKISLPSIYFKPSFSCRSGFIPNSILRSMFQMKEIEPIEMKMFQLRLVCSSFLTSSPVCFCREERE